MHWEEKKVFFWTWISHYVIYKCNQLIDDNSLPIRQNTKQQKPVAMLTAYAASVKISYGSWKLAKLSLHVSLSAAAPTVWEAVYINTGPTAAS